MSKSKRTLSDVVNEYMSTEELNAYVKNRDEILLERSKLNSLEYLYLCNLPEAVKSGGTGLSYDDLLKFYKETIKILRAMHPSYEPIWSSKYRHLIKGDENGSSNNTNT